MNLEGYKTILPTNIQENATRLIGKCFILHQDNDPKHPASSVKEFIRAKKWKVLDYPSRSPDLNPIDHELNQLKRRVKEDTPPKQATIGIGCIKGWEKYFKGWDQESGDVYGSQTHCCDCAQGICNLIIAFNLLYLPYVQLSQYLCSHQWVGWTLKVMFFLFVKTCMLWSQDICKYD